MDKAQVKNASRDARWWIAVIGGIFGILAALMAWKVIDRPAMRNELTFVEGKITTLNTSFDSKLKSVNNRMLRYQRTNLCVNIATRIAIVDLQLSNAMRERRQYVESGKQVPAATTREINKMSLTKSRLLKLQERSRCS